MTFRKRNRREDTIHLRRKTQFEIDMDLIGKGKRYILVNVLLGVVILVLVASAFLI